MLQSPERRIKLVQEIEHSNRHLVDSFKKQNSSEQEESEDDSIIDYEHISNCVEGDHDTFAVRKPSVFDKELRVQTCNLRQINHKLSGMKTSFNNEYLEDIELYTEEDPGERAAFIKQSTTQEVLKE